MSENHSASHIEILSVEANEMKSDKGAVFTVFTMPSIIHCDTGEIKVGNVKMMRNSRNADTFKTPTIGKFYPIYEPRPNWKSGECLPELVDLVPYVTSKPAVSSPAGGNKP